MITKRYLQFNLNGNQVGLTNLTEVQVLEDINNKYIEVTEEIDTTKIYKLNLEDNSLIDISEIKLLERLIPKKVNEIESFYESMRKLIVKKDNDYLVINCDQTWFNNLTNIRYGIEDASEKSGLDKTTIYYDYRIIINNQEKVIRLYYNIIRDLILLVSKQRSYCRVNCDIHLNKIKSINSLIELENYNYKIDTDGNTVESLNDFIL